MPMGIVNTVVNELKPAALIAVAGGIAAMVITLALGVVPVDAISQILVAIVLLVALVTLAAKTKLKGMTVYNFVKLFAAIGIVGSIIALIIPGVGGYILAAPEISWTGMLMSLIYIGAGQLILSKLGMKV